MARFTRGLLVAGVCAAFASCKSADPHALSWTVAVDPSLAGNYAVAEARIRRGGCASSEVVYRSQARDGMPAMRPPELGTGPFGFEVELRDAQCRVVGTGCREATLPSASGSVSVEVSAIAVPIPACAPSECTDGACIGRDAGGATDGGARVDGGNVTPDGGPRVDAAVRSDGGAGRDAGAVDAGPACTEGAPCAGGAGTCRRGACCTGCFDGTACVTTTSATACGVGGGACMRCPCASSTCSVAGECVGGEARVVSVAAGGAHACALTDTGQLACWGDDTNGQLGSRPGPSAPAGPVMLDDLWSTVSAGDTHTCAIRDDGRLYCWGDNSEGQLGTGDTGARALPQLVGTDSTWRRLSVGAQHTCGMRASNVFCFGANAAGQCARAAATTRVLTPSQVDAGGEEWRDLDAGGDVTCAISDRTGAISCWGANDAGQLGRGGSADATAHPTPAPVMFSGASWSQIAVGARHVCAITDGATAYCWGANDDGELGIGTHTQATMPTAVSGSWALVDSGNRFTLGVRSSAVWSWGVNSSGELGDPAVPAAGRATPGTTTFGTTRWTSLAAGSGFGCGIRDGSAYCWGANDHGQLGQGRAGTSSPSPARVRICL